MNSSNTARLGLVELSANEAEGVDGGVMVYVLAFAAGFGFAWAWDAAWSK